MKALVYTAKETLTYQDVPDATPQEGEEVVRIHASGICGSDMHAYLGHDARRPTPLTLGHEAAGIVMTGPDAGRRVTINPLVACDNCRDCRAGRTNICASREIISMPPRQGAFADQVAMPVGNLVTVPDHVPFEHAALTEPIACGWHGVRLGTRIVEGDLADARAVVIGGGAIGVGAALSLGAFGYGDITVIEPNALRRTRLAANPSFATTGLDDAPEPGSADIVIDAVGYAATREHASALARQGGVIVHIGLGEATGGLDIRRMTLQEIQFIGTYTYTAQDFRDTAQAIFDGRLGTFDWIEKRPLADGWQAFRDIRSGQAEAPKIILEPELG